MGAQMQTVGGGPATGLADDFVKMLQGGLQTGTFGAGMPAGSGAFANTHGIMATLNGLLSNGGGEAGNAMTTMINKETERSANELRSRFGAQGGTAFGTGAQHAEGLMRAEAAPKAALAVNQMQMQALMPLLQMMAQLSQLGIPQRQMIAKPNPWMQGLSALGGFMQGSGPGAIGQAFGGGSSVPAAPAGMGTDISTLPIMLA